MKKLLPLLFFVLSTLLFNVSCNSIKFAYNQADWLVLNQINDIACLDSDQSDKVEKKIDSFLAWHRKNELPIYAENLRILGNALNAGPLDKKTYDQTQKFFETTQDRTIAQIKDFLVDFLVSLPPKQIKCSIENIEEKGKDRQEEMDMDRDKYYEKVKEEMTEHAETWLGSVTDQQVAMIDTVIPSQEEEAAYKKITDRRKNYFTKLLLNPDKALKKKKMLEFIDNPDSFYTEEELKLVKMRRERSKNGLWKLAQTLTEKQRKTLAKTLLGYAEDFEELSKE